jgi:thiamine kinase-like enzyme
MNGLTLQLVDQIPKILAELSQAPSTLIHRDVHLENLLFDPTESIVLIDWPSAALGPAALDFTRFITTSMPTSVRRSIFNRLLSEYHEVLQTEGVRDYDMDVLRRHSALFALWVWAAMATGFRAGDIDQLLPRQKELQTVEIQRMLDFAKDWHLVEFLESSL